MRGLFARFRRRNPCPNAPQSREWLAELDGADLEIWAMAPSFAGVFALKVTGLSRGNALLWCDSAEWVNLPSRMKNVQIRLVSEAVQMPYVYKITCEAGVFSLVGGGLTCDWETETPDDKKSLLWRMGNEGGASWDDLKTEAEANEKEPKR